jgi:hypothetical protein
MAALAQRRTRLIAFHASTDYKTWEACRCSVLFPSDRVGYVLVLLQ